MKKQAPCNTQDQKQVEAYYRNVKEGDVAMLRDTQGNSLEYKVDKISGTNPRLGRVYIEQGDSWGGRAYWAKTGKSCMSPTGQINLVVPTEEVMNWIKEEQSSGIGSRVMTWDVDYNFTPPGQRTPERPGRSAADYAKMINESHAKRK